MIVILKITRIWRCSFSNKELEGQTLQRCYTLRQIEAATANFHESNILGEGGFGKVYKGKLSDGTLIAVKQLSTVSSQGNREFLNEVGLLSALQHPNLVKLFGCCIEGTQLMLIYEFLENNCLSNALFGSEGKRLNLDWPKRFNICLGIARGLAYLHEESSLKIVHRDVKTSNVLLGKDLTAKISDFGLAKLHEGEKGDISTRVAGTFGYMAPEYALLGQLSTKADVYGFGIVTLEIVSGKRMTKYRPSDEFIHLLDQASVLKERGKLIEIIDQNLGSRYQIEEALRMLEIGLLCSNKSPTLRPTMSAIVGMLEGHTPVAAPSIQCSNSGSCFGRVNSYNRLSPGSSWQNSQGDTRGSQTGKDGPWFECIDSLPAYEQKYPYSI